MSTAQLTSQQTVSYEDFGALGDGVADDLPAICRAHEHANAHGLPVRAREDAIYHLGGQALTALIATDTDWNTARFHIDDSGTVEDHKADLFKVISLTEEIDLEITSLTRDQRQLDIRPQQSCFVMAEFDGQNHYIRRGLNQNEGFPQHDCFILHPDGSIEGDIDWDYERITSVRVKPIDDALLTIQGGIFTTIANRMVQEVGYNYWSRCIRIARSNTTIDGLTHYVVGETSVGHPYNGFLNASLCANITYRNCFVTGHKIYSTIGSAGKPVNMGSYDLHANNIVNFHMINCRMNHICDHTHWGIIGSNFCKNIVLEDCELSRMDTHMGVSGHYIIRRCTLGHMGLNAIGRGLLRIEDSTLNGPRLISFRGDYGSTWEGTVEINNVRWIPSCGREAWPHILGTANDGMHDFGYACFMPQTVEIDGLHVEDSNTPADYTGMYIFQDPDDNKEDLPDERPFPYRRTESLSIKNLSCASGKEWKISPNEEFNKVVKVIIE